VLVLARSPVCERVRVVEVEDRVVVHLVIDQILMEAFIQIRIRSLVQVAMLPVGLHSLGYQSCCGVHPRQTLVFWSLDILLNWPGDHLSVHCAQILVAWLHVRWPVVIVRIVQIP